MRRSADPRAPGAHLVGGRGTRFLLAFLVVALVAATFLAISVGTVNVPLGTVWRVIAHHLGLSGTAPSPLDDQIVWVFRTPRVLLAAVVGGALAIAGVALQTLARNPLADPYLLGVSSGASVGAVLVMAYGSGVLGGLGVSGAAFVGAMATLALVFVLAQRAGRLAAGRLVLAGVAVSYLMEAVTSFVQLRTSPLELRGIMFWLLGSLAGAEWANLRIPTLAIAICTVWLLARARAMNVMTTGDDNANALGVTAAWFRTELLVVSSLLTATVVSVAGGIGFVGLIIPHAARLVVGPDHRRLLPVSVLVGAVFMVLVDLLTRVADRPNEVPVGIFTAAIGAPFFLVLLRRRGSE